MSTPIKKGLDNTIKNSISIDSDKKTTSATATNVAITMLALALLFSTAQFFGPRVHQSFIKLNRPFPSYAIHILQAVALVSIIYLAYCALKGKKTSDTQKDIIIQEVTDNLKKQEVKSSCDILNKKQDKNIVICENFDELHASFNKLIEQYKVLNKVLNQNKTKKLPVAKSKV